MSIFTVRASSWAELFDCAFRWQGTHLLGMQRPSSLRASLGTAIHAGTAAFDQARVEHKPIRADDAAGVFVDALRHPHEEVDYKSDKTITLNEAEIIGLALTVKYCTEVSPRFQYQSVEMKLNPLEIDCGDDVIIRLTGTMDRARVATVPQIQRIEEDDTRSGPTTGTIIPDIKTGGRIIENGEVALKGKSAQLGVYQLMYEDTTGDPTIGGQIIGLQTTKKAETAVSPIIDGKRVMLGNEQQKGLIEMAAVMFKTDFYPPNPQSSLCSKRYCARWDSCLFHD